MILSIRRFDFHEYRKHLSQETDTVIPLRNALEDLEYDDNESKNLQKSLVEQHWRDTGSKMEDNPPKVLTGAITIITKDITLI